MNLFKSIKNVKYYIEKLKNDMPFIKNQTQLQHHVKMINAMIVLVNDVELLLQSKYKTDVIDRLILSRFYSQIFPLYQSDQKIDIHQIVRNIDDDLKYPVEYQKDRIVSFLISKSVDAELQKPQPNLANITKQKEWELLLNNLLSEFKTQAKWN